MADRTTSTVAEVPVQAVTNARATATQAETLLSTGPAQARATSVVLEALVTIASRTPGWVCVIE